MSIKYLITGANGQLGYDVKKQLTKRGFEAIGTDVSDMDITDGTAVNEKFDAVNPDVVIHCAAWTAVDAKWYISARTMFSAQWEMSL